VLIPRLLTLLILAQPGLAQSPLGTEPLNQVSQIRILSREDAARALPVKLTGVVVYIGWKHLVIHDGQFSIFVDFRFAQKEGVWKGPLPDLRELKPGNHLEIEGVTDPGGFSPMILAAKFKRLGTQPIPQPIRPNLEQLLSTSLNTQWVEVEGVVTNFQDPPHFPQCVTMTVAGYPCPVIPSTRLKISQKELVDARVRVRGVLLDVANLRSQASGLKIHCNGAEDIEVIIPPPADPFQAPAVSLDSISAFHPEAKIGHRRVSSGIVTFAIPGKFFYVTDQQSNVRIESEATDILPGDLVEFSGFIDMSNILAVFRETVVRKIGKGEPPPSVEPKIEDILNPKVRSSSEMVTLPGHPDYNGRTIRLTGILRGVLPPDNEGYFTIVVESDGHLVRASIPEASPRWIEGSIVELKGICELELERTNHIPWFSISGFHLWLSSPDSLRVISEPPWWTPRRLVFLLVAIFLILCITLAWGYVMRRQVAIRSTQLAAEITARESAKLEFDAILHERQRLANDLHDNLEQTLAGLALQLEIASRSQKSDPERSFHHLKLAKQFLERSRKEAHRTVWDLRTQGQDGRDFLDILKERLLAMVEGTNITIKFSREGDPRPLPDLIAANLLLIAQEAATNALKHSGTEVIEIDFRQSPDDLKLVIRDKGCGFVVANAPGQHDGHFGLQGMRERAKRIGGKIELVSTPGTGTILQLTIPLQAGNSKVSS
jgi:signal transduction histidine kinase